MKKICVTGANGFIGSAVCEALAEKNKNVLGFIRNLNSVKESDNIKYIPVGDISIQSKWKCFLKDVDCIIHTAGMAHIIDKTKSQFRKIKLNIKDLEEEKFNFRMIINKDDYKKDKSNNIDNLYINDSD